MIVKAVYGDLPSGDSADVTEQVAAMVKSNILVVAASNDNFEDPASGITKQLRVDYTIDGIPGTKSVYENGTLKISLKDKPAPAPKTGSTRLVIRKATYGDLPDGHSADVTAIVAPMVENDALEVKADNENLGDPAPEVSKKLRVDYTLDGKDASQTVGENETLKISQRQLTGAFSRIRFAGR